MIVKTDPFVTSYSYQAFNKDEPQGYTVSFPRKTYPHAAVIEPGMRTALQVTHGGGVFDVEIAVAQVCKHLTIGDVIHCAHHDDDKLIGLDYRDAAILAGALNMFLPAVIWEENPEGDGDIVVDFYVSGMTRRPRMDLPVQASVSA